MHSVESFEINDAQQAKLINNHKNTKYKLLKTNATILTTLPKAYSFWASNAMVSLKMV